MKWWKWAVPLAAAVAAPFTFGGSLAGMFGAGGAAAATGGATAGGLTLGQLAGYGALTGGIQAATGIYGAHAQSSAANKAAQLSQQGNDAMIAYLKQKDEEDKRRYEEEQRLKKEQWDADQARRAPFREAAAWAAQAPPPVYQPAPMNPMAMTLGGLARRG